MSEKILLVQGDTGPQVIFDVTDVYTGSPINLAGATVVLKFRKVGEKVVKAVIPCYLAPGLKLADGTINAESPYNVAGAGGRCFAEWPAGVLDTAGEFEGEIEATFASGMIQTAFDKLRFKVREQF